MGLQSKPWVMLLPASGSLFLVGDGPFSPGKFCTRGELPCSLHLVWGRGITSSAAPWHKSDCKIPASRPEERPAGGKLMGEPSAKSPSRELVGRAQAPLFTEPVVLFPLHQGKGREEASLATKKNPGILFFKHLGLGWCSGVRQWKIFGK